jgi:hypothetical protein
MAPRRGTGEFCWQDSAGRADIVTRSWFFQPTAQLESLVEASRLNRVVMLTGKAGAAKSSLATALARPEIACGSVLDGFVHAIAIFSSDTNPASLGDDHAAGPSRRAAGYWAPAAAVSTCAPGFATPCWYRSAHGSRNPAAAGASGARADR